LNSKIQVKPWNRGTQGCLGTDPVLPWFFLGTQPILVFFFFYMEKTRVKPGKNRSEIRTKSRQISALVPRDLWAMMLPIIASKQEVQKAALIMHYVYSKALLRRNFERDRRKILKLAKNHRHAFTDGVKALYFRDLENSSVKSQRKLIVIQNQSTSSSQNLSTLQSLPQNNGTQ